MTDCCGETALMHEWCMAQVWCVRAQVLGQFWSNVCDLCVLEKIDKSVIYTARYHDSSRVFLLFFFTIQFFTW